MSSAAEAELGGLFINAKTAVPIWTTLEELGHNQLLSKLTTQLPVVWSTMKSNQRPPKQWTCGSIGWKTEKRENNLKFIGVQEN
jgi:hypothetical protein